MPVPGRGREEVSVLALATSLRPGSTSVEPRRPLRGTHALVDVRPDSPETTERCPCARKAWAEPLGEQPTPATSRAE